MQHDDRDFCGLCHFIPGFVQHQQCIQLENDLYCTACYFYLLQYEISVGNCSFSVKKTYLNQEAVAACRSLSAVAAVFVYASNEQKSVLARELGVAKRQWRLFSNDRNGV